MTKAEVLQRLDRLLSDIIPDLHGIEVFLANTKWGEPEPNFAKDATVIWQVLVDRAEQKGQIRELIGCISNAHPKYTSQLALILYDYRHSTTAKIALSFSCSTSFSINEERLLKKIFYNADKLEIEKEFSDGSTATRVILVRPIVKGKRILPSVIKIGPLALIEQEWQAAKKNLLKAQLPNFVSIQGEPAYIFHSENTYDGALCYEQVGGGIFHVESLAQYGSTASVTNVRHLINNRLLQQFDNLWQTTLEKEIINLRGSYDYLLPVNFMATPINDKRESAHEKIVNLDASKLSTESISKLVIQPGLQVQLISFEVTEVDAVNHEVTLNLPQNRQIKGSAFRIRLLSHRLSLEAQVGTTLPTVCCEIQQTRSNILVDLAKRFVENQMDLARHKVALPDTSKFVLPNPLLKLDDFLHRSHEVNFATIHGDLHLRNVLVDTEAQSAYIIDCASARRDYVLHDLLRLERSILTELLAEIYFQAPLSMEDVYMLLLSVHCAQKREARESGQIAIPVDLHAELYRVYVMLITIRRKAKPFLNPDELWQEYYAGLAIHLIGSLKFRVLDEAPPGRKPKMIAFWAAAIVSTFFDGLGECETLAWQTLNESE